jgi:hypothetical protein
LEVHDPGSISISMRVTWEVRALERVGGKKMRLGRFMFAHISPPKNLILVPWLMIAADFCVAFTVELVASVMAHSMNDGSAASLFLSKS